LMVSVRKLTGVPFTVIPLSPPAEEFTGTIAFKFLAPGPTTMLKPRILLLHEYDPKYDEFLPSSQVNICRDVTSGTPRA
jgi:hypothetical protein